MSQNSEIESNPTSSSGSVHPLRVVARADASDPLAANAQITLDLDDGATGVSLVFTGAPNAFGGGLPVSPEALQAVLADVPLDRIHLRVDVHPASRAGAEALFAYLGGRRIPPEQLDISLGIDPAAIFAGTGRLRMPIDALEASMPQSLSHFFALGLPGVLLEADGRVFHNAGATEAQELGAVLASAASYLRMFALARQSLHYAVPHLGFALSVDAEKTRSSAKIHALRLLWKRILDASGVEPLPVHVHAETSWRMLDAEDADRNAVLSGIAAQAAAEGGADSLSVLPSTIIHGIPVQAARRDAILTGLSAASITTASEADWMPAVELLSDTAWEEFNRIEKEGGILRSLLAGHIQSRIRASRDALSKEAGPSERKAEKMEFAGDAAVFCERLSPVRLG